MKNYTKKIILSLILVVAYLIINSASSQATTTGWWPIGSNDTDANTYYIDANGNRTADEVNSTNDNSLVKDGSYTKMAIGTENETCIEYGVYSRNYRVDNTIDPEELSYSADGQIHYGIDIRSFGYINSDGTYTSKNSGNLSHNISRTNYHNIVSIADGTVVCTSANRGTSAGISFEDQKKRQYSNDGGGYGNYVLVKYNINGSTVYALYAHMYSNSILVKAGQAVIKGQVLGKMGSSGDSGHPHLHFEIRKLGTSKSTLPSNLANTSSTNTYDPLGQNTTYLTPVIVVNKENQRSGFPTFKNIRVEVNKNNLIAYVNFSEDLLPNRSIVFTKLKVNIGDTVREFNGSRVIGSTAIFTYTLLTGDKGNVTFNSMEDITIKNSSGKYNYVLNLSNVNLLGENLYVEEKADLLKVEPGSKGDLDSSGRIEIYDTTILIRHLVGLQTESYTVTIDNADLTGDGKVSSVDLLKLLRVIVGTDTL